MNGGMVVGITSDDTVRLVLNRVEICTSIYQLCERRNMG